MKRKYWILVLFIIAFSSCTKRVYISEEVVYSVDGNSENVIDPSSSDNVETSTSSESNIIRSVIDYAHSLEGTPYKWGGTTTDGFDCSGFVQHVYAHYGIKIPRMPADMAAISKKVDMKDLKPGDLVYFKGSNIYSSDIGHVALVISATEDDFKMIHATSKGVMVNSFSQYEYWQTRYLFATRFDKTKLQGN